MKLLDKYKTMLSYCLKCKKIQNTYAITPMLLSKCSLCVSKKLRFIKEQEASELLSSLSLKTYYLLKIKKEFKNSKKQEIQDIFTEMS